MWNWPSVCLHLPCVSPTCAACKKQQLEFVLCQRPPIKWMRSTCGADSLIQTLGLSSSSEQQRTFQRAPAHNEYWLTDDWFTDWLEGGPVIQWLRAEGRDGQWQTDDVSQLMWARWWERIREWAWEPANDPNGEICFEDMSYTTRCQTYRSGWFMSYLRVAKQLQMVPPCGLSQKAECLPASSVP